MITGNLWTAKQTMKSTGRKDNADFVLKTELHPLEPLLQLLSS